MIMTFREPPEPIGLGDSLSFELSSLKIYGLYLFLRNVICLWYLMFSEKCCFVIFCVKIYLNRYAFSKRAKNRFRYFYLKR